MAKFRVEGVLQKRYLAVVCKDVEANNELGAFKAARDKVIAAQDFNHDGAEYSWLDDFELRAYRVKESDKEALLSQSAIESLRAEIAGIECLVKRVSTSVVDNYVAYNRDMSVLMERIDALEKRHADE